MSSPPQRTNGDLLRSRRSASAEGQGCLGSCAVITPVDELESKEVRGLGARSDASGNPSNKTNKDEQNNGPNSSRDDLT
jgi:hypothetical protein